MLRHRKSRQRSAHFPGVSEATVYGVRVPGTEGSAGMAVLVVEGRLDLPELREHLAGLLPSYARPLFLRIQKSIAVTATFKHRKTELVRDGFNPTATADAIYFDDPSLQAYARIDEKLYRRILAGEIRFSVRRAAARQHRW